MASAQYFHPAATITAGHLQSASCSAAASSR